MVTPPPPKNTSNPPDSLQQPWITLRVFCFVIDLILFTLKMPINSREIMLWKFIIIEHFLNKNIREL